jgi:type I restriction enzyme S subunit
MIFYKETDFRETPVGKIPKDWELRRLGEMCIKITDGTHKTPKFVDKGIPFLSTQNIIPFRRGFDFSEYEKYITREEHEELIKRCKPEKGDILVSKCGTIGRAKLIDVDYEFSIFVGLALLKLKKDLVSGEFLEQMLNYDPCRLRMEVCSPGSTRKTLTIHAIERLEVPFPPVEEQRAIAGVLGVVDSVIAKTDEVIAKTERLKKGLMQTLLTRGIGHKEFKETEIGKIPKTWQVVRVGDVLSLEYGKGLPERERISGEYPVVGSNGVVGYHTEALVKGPGIVVGRKGTIGAISWIERDFWPIDTTYYVKIKVTDVDWKWLFYELTYLNPTRFHLADVVPGLKRELVYSLKMALPPIHEQCKIAEILSAVDKKLEFERNEKVRLERIKCGLMDLLLTGKIRVKVD